jgi:putative ABC transport system permease protein
MSWFIVKSIIRRPARNGALMFAFAFIAASLFSGSYLLSGAGDSVQSGISRLGADLIVVPENSTAESEAVLLQGSPSTFFFDSGVVAGIENISGVAAVEPQLFIATLPATCCSMSIQLIAIDPARDFTITPWLADRQQQPLGKDEIIVGSSLPARTGTTLFFYGHPFVVAGKLDPTGTGLDMSVFIRTEDAYTMANESKETAVTPLQLPPDAVSAVLVKLDDPAETANISARIARDVPGTRVLSSSTLVSTVAGQLAGTTRLLSLAAAVATLVTLPLVALVSAMAVHERRREIGVLRALGATRVTVFRLVLGEFLLVAAAGAFLGILVSLGLLLLFGRALALALAVPLALPGLTSLLPAVGTAFGATVAVGGLAALFPAIQATRMEPYEAMRSGDI